MHACLFCFGPSSPLSPPATEAQYRLESSFLNSGSADVGFAGRGTDSSSGSCSCTGSLCAFFVLGFAASNPIRYAELKGCAALRAFAGGTSFGGVRTELSIVDEMVTRWWGGKWTSDCVIGTDGGGV